MEWRRRRIDVVEHALGAARGVQDNLLGAIMPQCKRIHPAPTARRAETGIPGAARWQSPHVVWRPPELA